MDKCLYKHNLKSRWVLFLAVFWNDYSHWLRTAVSCFVYSQMTVANVTQPKAVLSTVNVFAVYFKTKFEYLLSILCENELTWAGMTWHFKITENPKISQRFQGIQKMDSESALILNLFTVCWGRFKQNLKYFWKDYCSMKAYILEG